MIKRISLVNKFTALLLSFVFIISLFGFNTLPAYATNVRFPRVLSLGSTGLDVQILQRILNTTVPTTVSFTGAGSKGKESTYFGAKTRAALIKYQQLNNLPVTGIVDATTGDAINYRIQYDMATGVIGGCDTSFNNGATSSYKYELQKDLSVEGMLQAQNDIFKVNPYRSPLAPYIQTIVGPIPPPGAGPGSTVASSSFSISPASMSTVNFGGFVRIIGCNFATAPNTTNVVSATYNAQTITALNSNVIEFTLDSDLLKLFPSGTGGVASTTPRPTFFTPMNSSGLVRLSGTAGASPQPVAPSIVGTSINQTNGGSSFQTVNTPINVGSAIVVTGTGFDGDTYVLIDGRVAAHTASTDGKSVIFTVPATTSVNCNLYAQTTTCTQNSVPVSLGAHTLNVVTKVGSTASIPFTVSSGSSFVATASTTPTLLAAVPNSQPLGGQSILIGSGFDSNTSVLLDGGTVYQASSTDANTFIFNIPLNTNPSCNGSCFNTAITVGTHQLQVSNKNGTSNKITFTITPPPVVPVSNVSQTQTVIDYIQKQNLPNSTAENPKKVLGLPVVFMVQGPTGKSNAYQMYLGYQK